MVKTSGLSAGPRVWSLAALICATFFMPRLASAAEVLAFSMTVWDSGMSEREVSGHLFIEEGKFNGTFNQSGVRLHLWCEVTGDAISISGSIKTGFSPYPSNFSVEGPFRDGKFEQKYFSSGAGDYRGTVVVTRLTDADAESGSGTP